MVIYCTPHSGRNGSGAVYALLEHAYRTEFGGKHPEIMKTSHGKPYFAGSPDVHFSLSHARTHVLCAVSDSPVGCDIESPRSISQNALRFFSSPEELALFEPLDLWVLKESYVKLFGQTIASIRKLRFTRHGDGSPVLLSKQENPPHIFSGLYRVDDCSAAVCSLGASPSDSVVLI